jgi:hypothetical protein
MKRRTVRRVAWVGVALCAVALAFGLADLVFGPHHAAVHRGELP